MKTRIYEVHIEKSENLPKWPDYLRIDASIVVKGHKEQFECDLSTIHNGITYRQYTSAYVNYKTAEEVFKTTYHRLEDSIKEFGDITLKKRLNKKL